ncbi:haloacid dehalogenase type II [Amycolatopsis echigonensis]|uniref:Haloacid dehalogenase type II n=1 Tax=Amycolatopsis echigonensis TaxID=2576905 RepID=A0A8E2B9H2_9PSEU|nr:haloacid dehalogenase type II [Amycolatopsis echigonensis]MBB2504018.1 haloacid dehalogenase type II [Amycolatopsis echigonensis]
MARRPLVIAFDVIETLFPLEPLRTRIIDAGLPGHVLELWFTRLLRDAFALTATSGYRPFAEIAAGALASATGHTLSDDTVRGILAGFVELDPHPDVAVALGRARQAGVPVITLTNGSARTTRALLERAGVLDDVQQVLSVDDIQRWKPAPEIYRHAARVCQLEPEQLALVAAHAWDIHGAHHAGLVTGWVSRLENQYPPVFARPDVTGADLVGVVDALLALPSTG